MDRPTTPESLPSPPDPADVMSPPRGGDQSRPESPAGDPSGSRGSVAPAEDVWAAAVSHPRPTEPRTAAGRQTAGEDPHARAFAFEERLRRAHPWACVTYLLTAVNVVVYVAVARAGGEWVTQDAARLFDWGAAYGPSTFGEAPWRSVTSLFLHGELGHLAGNMCLLLAVGRLTERLLGPAAYLGVYLAAGIGGGYLAVAWYPTSVQYGASGAVMGVYGALWGCYLRGCRVVPWRVVGRCGALLLLAVMILADDWLSLNGSFFAHAGGAALGFLAGCLLGPSLRVRSEGLWGGSPNPNDGERVPGPSGGGRTRCCGRPPSPPWRGRRRSAPCTSPSGPPATRGRASARSGRRWTASGYSWRSTTGPSGGGPTAT